VEKALLLMPLDDELLILRGDIYRAAEEFSRALQDYTRVISVRPDSVTARVRRAEMRQAQGQYAEALGDINEALRHEPRSLQLIYRRGLILMDLGRPADALADFRAVARLSPEGDLRHKAQQRLKELGAR
jgi:tetratricopeptide (TPR) repeat protein